MRDGDIVDASDPTGVKGFLVSGTWGMLPVGQVDTP